MEQEDALPHVWTWADDDGCDHMIVAGAPLEVGDGSRPAFQAMCGKAILVRELIRRSRFCQCADCYKQLTELLAERLDA